MKTRRTSHYMTEEGFNKIKSLTDLKLKNTQISQILNTSAGTVCAIKRNPDFAAYKAEQKAYFEKKKAANKPEIKGEETTTPRVETTYDVLIDIRGELRTLNRIVALSGKSKSFRLF